MAAAMSETLWEHHGNDMKSCSGCRHTYSGCTFSSAHPQTESRKSVRMVGIRYKTETKEWKVYKRDPMTASAAITCEGRDVIIASQKKLAETSMMLFSQHPASILPTSSSLRRCIETTQGSYRLKAPIWRIRYKPR
jgi:hypothetical protein